MGDIRRGPARPSFAGAGWAADRRAILIPLAVWAASRTLLLLVVWGGLLASEPEAGWRAFPDHLFLDGWARWDSAWYAEIARFGYEAPEQIVEGEQRNTHFFPLYPLSMRAVGRLTGDVFLAGMLISHLCLLVALILLYRLTSDKLGEAVAVRAVLLMALNPFSFFFSAVYTESLFLTLVLGAFLLAERQRWFGAALLAGLAGVTRIVGLLVPAAIGLAYLRRRRWRLRPWRWDLVALLPGLAIPLVHLAFLSLRYGTPLELLDAHYVDGWGLTHWWPRTSLEQKHWLYILLGIALSAAAIRGIGPEYGLWGVATGLLHVTAWTGGGRYAMVLFPATMMLAKLLRNRYLFAAVLIYCGYYLIDYALRFSHWRWVA